MSNSNIGSFSQSYVDELNQQIVGNGEKWGNGTEEKIKDLFAEPSQYFHNGKYYNSIRAAYQDLLCMSFSILGIEMTQLPKTTFSSYTF